MRIGPAIAMAPGYGEQTVSPRIRLVVAIFLSIALTPLLAHELPDVEATHASISEFAVRETIIGGFYGMLARSCIFVLEKAGAIIGQSVAISQLAAISSTPMTIFSHILIVAGLAIAFGYNLEVILLRLFYNSYSIFPFMEWGFFARMAEVVIDTFSWIERHAYTLAAIFLAFALLSNLTFGFVNKALPQLMVTFVTTPLVSWFTIVLLSAYGPAIFWGWWDKVRVFFARYLVLP